MPAHREPDPAPPDAPRVPSLKRAIDQSEKVKGRMEEAAVEREAAEELVAVNDALSGEVAERDALEDRVKESTSALTKSLEAEGLARHRALHDAVTSLPNATLFGDRLGHALEQAQRHGWQFAVLFLDLDGFKQINDTHGHEAGDRVLQVVAALSFAAKLGRRLAEPRVFEKRWLTVGVSIGPGLYPNDATTAAGLPACADTAMYVAKKERRGVVRFSGTAAG